MNATIMRTVKIVLTTDNIMHGITIIVEYQHIQEVLTDTIICHSMTVQPIVLVKMVVTVSLMMIFLF